nr:MAG TPA: hypothetical protein [Caudoviricetes sp.]
MSTPIAYTPAHSITPLIAALPARETLPTQTDSMTEWVLTHHTA